MLFIQILKSNQLYSAYKIDLISHPAHTGGAKGVIKQDGFFSLFLGNQSGKTVYSNNLKHSTYITFCPWRRNWVNTHTNLIQCVCYFGSWNKKEMSKNLHKDFMQFLQYLITVLVIRFLRIPIFSFKIALLFTDNRGEELDSPPINICINSCVFT